MASINISDSVWDSRVQVLWVAVALLYSFSDDKVLGNKGLSSFIILMGGGLVFFLIIHVLVCGMMDRTRQTLMVALTASSVLIYQSAAKFKDYGDAFFASIFALLVATLLWMPDNYKKRNRLMVNSIVIMALILWVSLIQLGTTVLSKLILKALQEPDNYMIYGPQGVGAFYALGIGIILGCQMLPLNKSDSKSRTLQDKIILRRSIFLGLSASVVGYFIEDKIIKTFNDNICWALAVTIIFASATMPICVLGFKQFFVDRKKAFFGIKNRYFSFFLILLAIGLYSTEIIQVYFSMNYIDGFTSWKRFIYVEGLSVLGLYFSLVSWGVAADKACSKFRGQLLNWMQ
ncbi:hypothetical protein [Methylomagnum sp.]